MEPMATAALTSECPLIPRSCEKISRCPSTCSGRTAKYSNFHMPHPFVVRLSNHERIFSQLPFCKGGILAVTTLTPLWKRGEGEIFGPTDADIIHRISDTPLEQVGFIDSIGDKGATVPRQRSV